MFTATTETEHKQKKFATPSKNIVEKKYEMKKKAIAKAFALQVNTKRQANAYNKCKSSG